MTFFYNLHFCPLTGRREFVQRLKLEATLNVHDGCVSAPHICESTPTFFFCALAKKHITFPLPVCQFVRPQNLTESRSLTSGQVLNASEKPEADITVTCPDTVSARAVSPSKTPKQPQRTSPRRAAD